MILIVRSQKNKKKSFLNKFSKKLRNEVFQANIILMPTVILTKNKMTKNQLDINYLKKGFLSKKCTPCQRSIRFGLLPCGWLLNSKL